jgi:glutathione-specific gamma-glutamylcyclotransferase
MPANDRRFELTAELVALVERLEPDPGPPPGELEHTDEDFSAMAERVLAGRREPDLWLFAYGSLIWKPDFEHVESTAAVARGWHRSFCMRLTRWRGTREQPALMMALDRGGSCTGVAYRLRDDDPHGQVVRLLRRETDGNPATNVPRWLTVTTERGPRQALSFVASPSGPNYAGRLPHADVARTLARAAGHWGSAAQYLYNTVTKLDEEGIHDRNLWTLQALVAEEIRRMKRQPGPVRAHSSAEAL